MPSLTLGTCVAGTPGQSPVPGGPCSALRGPCRVTRGPCCPAFPSQGTPIIFCCRPACFLSQGLVSIYPGPDPDPEISDTPPPRPRPGTLCARPHVSPPRVSSREDAPDPPPGCSLPFLSSPSTPPPLVPPTSSGLGPEPRQALVLGTGGSIWQRGHMRANPRRPACPPAGWAPSSSPGAPFCENALCGAH